MRRIQEPFSAFSGDQLCLFISSAQEIAVNCCGVSSVVCAGIYGVKVQVLVNSSGIPVEFGFVPGCESDVQALKKLPLAVAAESKIYGDAAYTDYQAEDDMRNAELVELMIQRKSNSLRPDEPWIRFIKEQMRKGIETSFSEIKALFLRKIHAVTFKGFLLKLVMFILAFTLNKLTDN